MRLNKLFLIGAVALGLGLTACNSDEVPNPDNGGDGNTYVGLTLKLPKSAAGTRALPGDYNPAGEWDGRDAINTIHVYMVNVSQNSINKTTFSNVASFYGITAEGVLNPKLAVEATAGENVKAYVVVNGYAGTITTLDAISTAAAFDAAFKDVQAANASQVANYNTTVASKEVIMMTNDVEPVALVVAADVTEAQAIAGSANQIKVKVERVVARAMVTIAPKSTATGWTIAGKGEIVDVTYAVGQSNKNFYIMKQVGATAYNVPAPVFGYVPSGDWGTTGKGYFDYAGLSEFSPIQESTGFTNAIVTPLLNSETTSKFVLPVTHAVTGVPTDGAAYSSNYRKGNSTYFEVRGVFVPSDNLKDTGAAYVAGNPVFYGATDGKFYSTRVKAEAMGGTDGDKNQQATEYKSSGAGVLMKYVLWLNPNYIPGVVEAGTDYKTSESPTVRNQVYHARIAGFSAIGLPNNPLDPNDPNDPNNPDNPIKPDDNLETDKTYLSVQVTVLDWGVHSYEVTPGQDY